MQNTPFTTSGRAKRIFTIILCVMMGFTATQGIAMDAFIEIDPIVENVQVMTLDFTFSEPNLVREGEYYQVVMGDLDNFGLPGEPVLPFKTVKVLIPMNHEVTQITVTPLSDLTIRGNYFIKPGQVQVPIISHENDVNNENRIIEYPYSSNVPYTEVKNPYELWKEKQAQYPDQSTENIENNAREVISDYLTKPNEDVYRSNTPFPPEIFKSIGVQYLRGYAIHVLNLYPISYIPSSGKISYYEKMQVDIETTETANANDGLSLLRSSTDDYTLVEDMAVNPTALGSYQMPILAKGTPSDTPSSIVDPADTYQYVIITNAALNASSATYTFQDLVARKNAKGIPATIVTVEDITADPDYNGVDTQEEIRNFIIDAYLNWETEYVLLGGDGDGADVGGESGDTIIPHRGFYAIAYGMPDDDIPADLYYSCLDGDFDFDGDGIYGEINDGPGGGEVDLFAEVYVGRAPVDSDAELSNFIMKTLAYEDAVGDYLKEVLMLGELLWADPTWGGDYKDEIAFGCWANPPIPGDYNLTILYDRDLDPLSWDKWDLIPMINDGLHIINHLGHSNVDYCMRLYNPDVDNEFNNTEYFFGYSQGCYDGSFDNRNTGGGYTTYDCICEHMVATPHGAFAFIGNSRYGWGEHLGTNGSSQFFDRKLFDAFFGQDIRELGKANQYSKEQNIGIINSDAIRWCYYQLTLFGDPEISIKDPTPPEHEIAVTSLFVDTYQVPSDNTSVNATILNQGLNNESNIQVNFTVDAAVVDTQTIAFLENGIATPVSFSWTTPATEGVYLVGIETTPVPGENITTNNRRERDVIVGLDIAVTDISVSDTLDVFEPTYVNATVANQGKIDANNIIVDLRVSGFIVDSTNISDLASGKDTQLQFEWTPAATGTQLVEVVANPLPNEPFTDNNVIGKNVLVTHIIYEEDVESGENGWTANGLWHISTDRSAPSTSLSPTHSWCYNDGVDFDTGVANSGSVTSPPIDVSWCTEALLRFKGWYETEGTGSTWDQRWVHISTDGGAFQPVEQFYADPMYNWNDYEVNISAYLGNTIQIRFYFDTIDSVANNFEGWYIDDILILGNLLEHDIAVTNLTAPDWLEPFDTGYVNATICNMGMNNETNIEINFRVNGAIENSTTIPALNIAESSFVSFEWTPIIEGNYTVAIESVPVENETFVSNNIQEKNVLVTYFPDIWVDPITFDVAVQSGEIHQEILTIGNDGLADLNYNILVGGTGGDDFLFFDDFDEEIEGTSPPVEWAEDVVWIPDNCEVDNTQFSSSPHSMWLRDSASLGYCHHDEADGILDEPISFKMYIPDQTFERYFITQSVTGSRDTGEFLIFIKFDYVAPNYNIYYYNGSSWIDTGHDYVEDTWFEIKVVHNFDDDTFDLWYDGTPVGTDLSFWQKGRTSAKSLQFVVNQNQAWIDDILIGSNLSILGGWLSISPDEVGQLDRAGQLVSPDWLSGGYYPDRAGTIYGATWTDGLPPSTDSAPPKLNLVFSDNFDSEAEGTSPPVNWIKDTTFGITTFEVDDAQYKTSPHSALISQAAGSGMGRIEQDFTSEPITFWIYFDTTTDSRYISVAGATGDYDNANIGTLLFFDDSANIQFYESGGWTDTTVNYATGWHWIKIINDFPNDQFDMWYDGILIVDDGGWINSQATGKAVHFYPTATSNMWIDDVQIEEIPQSSIFEDNFDSETEGTSPPINWVIDGSYPPDYCEVDDVQAHSSPHSMLLKKLTSDLGWCHHDIPAGVTNEKFTMWVYFASTTTRQHIITNKATGDHVPTNIAAQIQFRNDGSIWYYDGSYHNTGYTYSTGWHEFEIIHDCPNDQFDLWYDGTQIIDDGGFRNTASSIKSLHFQVDALFGTNEMWIDDVQIGNETEGTADWLSVFPETGTLPPFGVNNHTITFNATTLDPGFYQANITISSNDPDEAEVIIPVNMTVLSAPHDLSVLDMSVEGSFEAGKPLWINGTILNQGYENETNVEVQLLVDLGLENSTIIPSLNSTQQEGVLFVWMPPLGVQYTLSLFIVPVTGENITYNNWWNETVDVFALPDIWVDPTSFDFVVEAGQVDSDILTIGNDGLGNLDFVINSQSGSSGTQEILAYSEYADMGPTGEYYNTFLAINQVTTDYNVTELPVYTLLDSYISGKDILLIPEQESADYATMESIGLFWAPTLNTFLNNGGTIIVCDFVGFSCATYGILVGAGLMDISGGSSVTSQPVYVVDPSDPITDGVAGSFTAPNGAMNFFTTEENVLVDDGSNPVVIHKEIGCGDVVLIGFDYFSLTELDANRIIGNAVNYSSWGGSSALPDWLSVYPDNGTVEPYSQMNVTVTVNATMLYSGFYQANITVSSNDPDDAEIIVPVNLTVLPPEHDIAVFDLSAPNPAEYNKSCWVNATVKNAVVGSMSNYSFNNESMVYNTTGTEPLNGDGNFWFYLPHGNITGNLTLFYCEQTPGSWDVCEDFVIDNVTGNVTVLWGTPDPGWEFYAWYNYTATAGPETNVTVDFIVDEVVIDSTLISTIEPGEEIPVSFIWTPNATGTQNITIYANPVPGEILVWNNSESMLVDVFAYADIWVIPDSYNFTVTAGDIHQDNMTIGNDGFADLYFNITDDAGGIASNPVFNPSFETGDFTDWITQDLAAPLDPLQVVMAGYVGWFFPVTPTNGSFAVSHGFDGDGPGTIQVAQDLAIPPGATTLEFDYRAGWSNGGSLDRIFRVDIEPAGGGPPIQSDIILVAAAGTNVGDTGDLHGIVDLSAFAGSTVRISFEWDVPEFYTGPGQFQLDNVTVSGGGADCDWLSEFPTSGIVPPSNDTNIIITVNATMLDPGFYQANITIAGNDPDENPVIVPVNLTVLPPDHDIKVSDIQAPSQMYLGDTEQVNATVTNQGLFNEPNIEVQLREDGITIDTLFIGLNSGNSQVVSFDYTPIFAGMFNISIYAVPVPGENITYNNEDWAFVEVIAVPDIWVEPTSFDFVVELGQTDSDNLTIGNDGLLELFFNISSLLPSEINVGLTSGDAVQRTALETDLTNIGFNVFAISSVDDAVANNCQAIIDYVGTSTVSDGAMTLSTYVSNGNGYLQIGDWGRDLIPNLWESIGFGTIVTTTVVDPTHPITQMIPPTYDSYGLWHNSGMGYVGWSTSATAVDIMGLQAAGYGYHPKGVAADTLGSGNLVFIGYEPYGIDATVDDLRVLLNSVVFTALGASGSGGLPDWLSVNPDNGTVASMSQMDIDVMVDTSSLTPGFYQANITISSNDPDEPEIIVPVNLTVIPPPHDIAVEDMDVKPFAKPDASIPVNATIRNLGTNDESNVQINFKVDGIIEDSQTLGSIASGTFEFVTFYWTPVLEGTYTLEIEAVPVPGETYIDNNNQSAVVDVFEPAPILLVDDDLGISSESWYYNAVIASGYEYDIWETMFEGIPPADLLMMYSVVIWFTGNDFDTSLTSSERDVISTYLNNGGKMYISGELIAYDAFWTGWIPWYENYLYASIVNELVMGIQTFVGIPGDPIGDSMVLDYYIGDYCPELWDYSSHNIPIAPGSTSFEFDLTNYSGMTKVDTGIYKLVYSSFDFAGVNDNATRNELMYRILTWLGIADIEPPQHSNEHPGIGEVTEDPRPIIWVHVTDNVEVNVSTIRLYVLGFPVFYDLSPIPGGYNVSYTHGADYPEGPIPVRIVARDTSDNLLDFTWTWYLDLSPPEAWDIDPPPGGVSLNNTPLIRLNVTDIGGVVRETMRLYVQDFAVWYEYSTIENGYHVWYAHLAGFSSGELVRCRIRAEDTLGHWLDYSWNFTVPHSFDVPLLTGWNLISLPLVQTDTSILNVLSSIDGQWDYVQYYDASDAADHWKSYATFKPSSLNDLLALDHTMGFWIHMTTNTNFTVCGLPPGNISIPLKAGWNLVGYPVQDDGTYTVGDLKLDTGAEIVEGYNSSAPYRISQLPDSYVLKKGEGYWVRVASDTSWTLTNSIPPSNPLSIEDTGDATRTKGSGEVANTVMETPPPLMSPAQRERNEVIALGGNDEYHSGASSEGAILFIALAAMFISLVYLPLRRRRK